MSATLDLKHIDLRVHDLARSARFYVHELGFSASSQRGTTVDFAASAGAEPILSLTEDRTAVRPAPACAGLFHAALLLPSRAALGAWLRGAVERGVNFDGMADHAVSEALYLSDPEGNGLEFYADRPRAAWPYEGSDVQMVTEPLDIPSLLAAGSGRPGTLEGAHWGHLHLRVTNLDQTERFYTAHLGMAVTQRSFPGARFLAADGYHHHLGTNTWGHPRSPQPAGSLGLAGATFAWRGATSPQQLRDPDQIAINIVPRGV